MTRADFVALLTDVIKGISHTQATKIANHANRKFIYELLTTAQPEDDELAD